MRDRKDQGASPSGYGSVDGRPLDCDQRIIDSSGRTPMGSFDFLRGIDGTSGGNRNVEPETASGWQSANPAYSRFAIIISFAFIAAMLIMVAVKEGTA